MTKTYKQLLKQARTQAEDLGYTPGDFYTLIRSIRGVDAYVRSNLSRKDINKRLQRQINKFSREIKSRGVYFNRALKLSRQLRTPLRIPAVQQGTSRDVWKKETSRLFSLAKRRRTAEVEKIEEEQRPTLGRISALVGRVRENLRTTKKAKKIRKKLSDVVTERQIRLNHFQQILDRITYDNVLLTDRQARRLYNNIVNAGKYTIEVIYDTPMRDEIHFSVSNITRNDLINIFKTGVQEFVNPEFGSDILASLNIMSIERLKISKRKPPKIGKLFKNKSGAFFPYINTSNIDLSEYQIFNQDQAYDTNITEKREQCLIYCLKQSGINENVINELKLSYLNAEDNDKHYVHIRKSDLKKIANIVRHDIYIHHLDNKNKRHTDKHISQTKEEGAKVIEIALHSGHYFIYEKTRYSRCSIINYDLLKNEQDFHKIVKYRKIKKTGKIRYERGDERKITSLQLVQKFYEANRFEQLDLVQFEETASNADLKDHIYLENIENEQQLTEYSDKEKEPYDIYYADCESYVKDVDYHKLQLLGYSEDADNDDHTTEFNINDDAYETYDDEITRAQLLVNRFLNIMTNKGKTDAIVYFHNLKYDYHLLQQYLKIQDICEKDNQLYSVTVQYNKKKVILKDSFKMIPFALSKFAKSFELGDKYAKKEAIAYDYYTVQNNNKRIKTREYRQLLSSKDKTIFKEEVKKCESYDKRTKTFNPMTYYKEYLRLDCLCLKKGIQKFKEIIQEITKKDDEDEGMNIHDYLTISSLTDAYFKRMGCYEGVYEMKGNLRAYVALAVFGGRVCTNKKYEKKVLNEKMADYDGCSLYPSAINRLCRVMGLPMGKAKRYAKDDLKNWEDKLYSILTVKINKVNKTQQMPFIAQKVDGIINYSNEAPEEEMIIDSITLQDYIKFHDIDYEILDGVYWNEGGNKKMGEVIQNLYNTRLKYKKTKKALANTLKLMLNSAYGKTITKKTNTKKTIIKVNSWKKVNNKWEYGEKTNLNDYVYNNFNTIRSYRKINKDQYEIESICADNSYNRGHIGCAILSTSKRIMNEVFDVANDNGYIIYYTDTDSLHIKYDDVPKLEAKYKERYGRELNGKQLEQFHVDFDLDGAAGEIYATHSIFLGKKSYMDMLESVDDKGNVIKGYHVRLKGITEAGLINEANKYITDEDPAGFLGLYTQLSQGIEKEIILNPYDENTKNEKVMFQYKNGNVMTRARNKFTRKVKF